MRILVTGGAGFIGSHVTDALVARGHDVDVLDDLSSGRKEYVNQEATLHTHDIRSAEAAALVTEKEYDLLVHHAAQMDVRRSVKDPSFDADVNIRGLLNLMEAGRKAGLRKVVFASTGGAIYGEPEYAPQDEDHPIRPISPYGIAKLSSERYLYFYQHQYEIPFVSLRYANVYGPRQNPHGEAGVVAIFSQRLLEGEDAFVNGDGKQTRDFVYVQDVVRANLAALDIEEGGIFNVGTGIETDIVTLFRLIRDQIDPDVPERYSDAKPGEQQRSVLSYAHAQEVLGWEPTIDLETGLERTVNWFRSHTYA